VVSKFGFALAAAACVLAGFMAGRWRSTDRVAELPRHKLLRPLTLQAKAGSVGTLPEGTTLYEYRVLPEITTYVVFVNTKWRSLLSEVEGGPARVQPIDAYIEPMQR
jgi:hypothetical protein